MKRLNDPVSIYETEAMEGLPLRPRKRTCDDMLLTMNSGFIRTLYPAVDRAFAALRAGRKRCGLSLAGSVALGLLGAGGIFPFAITAPPALAQDLGGAPETAQPPITPATSAPNTAPSAPQPIFPESTTSTTPYNPTTSSAASPLGPPLSAGLGYGPIRPGDIVEVQVFDAPEYSVRMPVSSSGDIAIPYAGIFHIEGMTSTKASDAIVQLFKDRQILRNPHVIVTTQQFGYSVTVLGEVRTPGIYALAGRKRLIDILTEAGGVTDRAGHLIEVFGAGSMKDRRSLLWDPTLRENDTADVQLKAGETVLVSRCGVVYVGGNVARPGAFPLCDSNHTTLSQVIAEAQGIRPSSWPQRTLLLRNAETGTRVVEKVRLNDVLRGKKPDIIMQPDDIVFIPPSSMKAASKIMVGAALGFATQAYIFLQR